MEKLLFQIGYFMAVLEKNGLIDTAATDDSFAVAREMANDLYMAGIEDISDSDSDYWETLNVRNHVRSLLIQRYGVPHRFLHDEPSLPRDLCMVCALRRDEGKHEEN